MCSSSVQRRGATRLGGERSRGGSHWKRLVYFARYVFPLFPRGVNGSPPVVSKRLFHMMGNCEFFPPKGGNNGPAILSLFHHRFHPVILSAIRDLIILHIFLTYTGYYAVAGRKTRSFPHHEFLYRNHTHKMQKIYIPNHLSYFTFLNQPHLSYF